MEQHRDVRVRGRGKYWASLLFFQEQGNSKQDEVGEDGGRLTEVKNTFRIFYPDMVRLDLRFL